LTDEWRAKHSKTEPASKLLEHILAERRKKWEEDQSLNSPLPTRRRRKAGKEKYVEPAGPDKIGLPELPRNWIVASLSGLQT